MAKTNRWVYFFGGGKADGRGDQRELLGGKGAGLAEMTRIGLPVPGGFTITTEACASFHRSRSWPKGLEQEIRRHLAKLERICGKKLGEADDPLLVSVRSGAARSMPGMMDTILNLGLNDASVEGLARVSDSRRFALDSYRRFIMMYGSTAKGIAHGLFEDEFDQLKETRTRARLGKSADDKVVDTEVNADELADLVTRFKTVYAEHAHEPFPQDPFEQLRGAIDAVFDSWMADKAITYREVEHITGLNGTGVNVCQMVFGNMGDDCGTGVCFTRDPSTGESVFYGDMLINAQGEDVVAGVRTPLPLAELARCMPEIYDQLEAVRVMLEVHYHDMQDLEFTFERGKLYMLQCRTGKRSPVAAFKIAVDQATTGLVSAADAKRLVKKGYLPAKYGSAASKPVLTKDEAILRMTGQDVERLFSPIIAASVPRDELDTRRLGHGIGAVPGAACGVVSFTAEDAEARAERGEKVILVRKETSPEDVGGMHAAVGVLTATGGKTSHAAVVARGWGKCCIVGCEALRIDMDRAVMTVGDHVVEQGQPITLDGSTGNIYGGEIPLDRPSPPAEYETLMTWCDRRRRMKVRANADTPEDAEKAIEFGAEGIGLCRTEHMFFDPNEPQRIGAMREMILATTESHRRAALDKLLPYQRKDFEGVFTAMDGKPVTIRLLDPPLHEFLPHHDNPDAQQAIADALSGVDAACGESANDTASDAQDAPGLIDVPIAAPAVADDDTMLAGEGDGGSSAVATCDRPSAAASSGRTVTLDDVQRRVDQLSESNPMLGHRGCRLCMTYPEILEMQVRAIMEAAVACHKRGIKVRPEIMIPLTIDDKELAILTDHTRRIADGVRAESGAKISYLVGTMIETPRAALLADRMARVAQFFSFGTNDLTQMTMALSRDDAGKFLPHYVDETKAGVFADDPFQTLDIAGVGQLVRSACVGGRATAPKIKLGICGEHGGDPASIQFCEEVGLDYVSCSPYRVPVARLAAAQATIGAATSTGSSRRGSRPEPRASARAASAAAKTSARSTAKKKTKTVAGKKKTKSAKGGAKRKKAKKATARKAKKKASGKSKKKTGAKKPKSVKKRATAKKKKAGKKRR